MASLLWWLNVRLRMTWALWRGYAVAYRVTVIGELRLDLEEPGHVVECVVRSSVGGPPPPPELKLEA